MNSESTSQAMYDSIIKDRRIKVFLSSTFKDMSEERDYLAKNVFMELEAEALKRNVALNLLDLRWGITAEESKQGLVTEICLKEIEDSRPFFIGIIGDRYGWIPKEDDFPADSFLFENFPWVKDDIKNGLSITEMEIQYGVLRNKLPINAFFYIKEGQIDSTDNTPEEVEKLNNLKTKIVAQKDHPVKYYKTPKELGDLIRADIMSQIETIFPRPQKSDPIIESDFIQDCILRSKTDFYVPIDGAYEYIDNFVNSPQRLLVIKGESGSGKSSLLANWATRFKDEKYYVIYHFIDSSGHCNQYPLIVIRFYYHICSLLNKVPSVNWKSMFVEEYVYSLNELLSTTNKYFIFIIDALDQLDKGDNAHLLQWFPNLNEKIKIICSTNDEIRDITQALTNKSATFYELNLFEDIDFQSIAANGYLKRYGKKLERGRIEHIHKNNIFKNPLLFYSLIEELRLWGSFDELDKALIDYVKVSSSDDFLNKVFDRIETDITTSCSGIVGDVFILLSMCRNGILDTEVARILDIPIVYVSSVMHKCHRFISVLGGRSAISHSIICSLVSVRYKDLKEEIATKYIIYLQNRLNVAEKRDYTDTVLELANLLYHSSLDNDLFELCTNPNAFISLSLFGGTDEDVYFKYLYNKGYAIHKIIDRINELKIESESKDVYIRMILFKARGLCAILHANDSLRIILEYSDSYFKSSKNPPNDIIDWLAFLNDNLIYCTRFNNIEKAIKLADEIITIDVNDEKVLYYQAKAYACKAELIYHLNFKKSINYLEKAVELSLETDNYEIAIVCLINMGLFHSQNGFYDKALQNYKRALNLIDRKIQNDASLIIQKETCYENLSALYNRLGNVDQMIKYEYLADKCFLTIQDSIFVNRLQPIQIVSRHRGAGFNLMKDGKIEDGIERLNKALKTLDFYKKEIPSEDYLKERFFILHDIAKGYAFNKDYVSAAQQLILYQSQIEKAYNSNSQLFHELYFDYLLTLANVLSDLGYNQASIVCLNNVVREGDFVRNKLVLGKKSLLAEVWKKIASIRIKEGESKQAISAFDHAVNEYLTVIKEDTSFLKAFTQCVIAKEYYKTNEKTITNFKDTNLKQLYENNNNNNTNIKLYIAIYLLISYLSDEKGENSQIEKYVEHILDSDFFEYKGKNTPQYLALLPILAECCDNLSVSYYDIRNMDKSIYYSKLSLSIYERIPNDRYLLQKLCSIHHLANTLDTVGEKETAIKYYKKAIGEAKEATSLDAEMIYQRASLLYDYGIALYEYNNDEAETILDEAYEAAYSIYNEKTDVAILIADIQDSLGSIYDDSVS